MTEVEIIGGDKEHAEFSASGSHRWLNCPGSQALCKRAPPAPPSRYADEGTQAHLCLEFLLKNRNRLSAAVASASKRFNADMVKHAKEAVEWALAQEPGEILSETRVDSSPFTTTGQFGTLDMAIVREFGRLTVVDYKYGAGIAVDPVYDDGQANSQLAYYALGLYFTYEDYNFDSVELVVIQPRAYHHSGDTIRTHTMPIGDLLAWKQVFRDGVMATSDANAPLKAGSWCKFCTAASICPELKDNSFREAQIVFAEPGIVQTPELETIRIPNLGQILSACDKLEDWIKAVREHAQGVMEAGGTVPGWKLVQKRAQRKWKNEEQASAEARKQWGDSAFEPASLLSPAQLEKRVKGANEFVKKHVTAESSGLTLAPASDKRPAIEPAAKVFQLEQDEMFA